MRALVFAAVIGGCCRSPSHTFPMATQPERTCDTGGPGGTDVYIWGCVDNQHVVIHRFRGEWGCSDPVREVAACGATTPFEDANARVLADCRAPAKEW